MNKNRSFYLLIVIVIVIMILLCLLYLMVPDGYQNYIVFVREVLLMGGGIITAVYVGRGFYFQVEWNKSDVSFKLLGDFNDKKMGRNRSRLEKAYKGDKKCFYDRLRQDDVLWHSFLMLSGFFEDMSMAIQRGYVDEELIYFSLRNIVKVNWGVLKDCIYEYRVKEGCQYYLSEFEKLGKSWEKGISLTSEKKFPDQFNYSSGLEDAVY